MSIRHQRLAPLVAAGVLSIIAISQASADTCERSRDYLLGGLAGELPQSAQSYQQLFNICIATADIGNVKDAYILKDGGIAAVAKNDSVGATASTLSEFCRRFPRATLRFISRKERARATTVGKVVSLSSGGITSCRKIMGLADK